MQLEWHKTSIHTDRKNMSKANLYLLIYPKIRRKMSYNECIISLVLSSLDAFFSESALIKGQNLFQISIYNSTIYFI